MVKTDSPWFINASQFHTNKQKSLCGLLKHYEAPAYMREFAITSGYRRKLSYGECVIRLLPMNYIAIHKMNDIISSSSFLFI